MGEGKNPYPLFCLDMNTAITSSIPVPAGLPSNVSTTETLGDRSIGGFKQGIDMSSHEDKKETVHSIASAMETGDERVRCFGAKALGIIKGDEAVDILINYLNDPDPDVRCDAAMALSEIKEDRAVSYLIELLNDEDCMAKLSAIDALSKIGSSIAVEPLISAASSTSSVPSTLSDLSWDYKWDIQERVVSALGMFRDNRAVDALIGFLNNEEFEPMQGTIFKALVQQGEKRGIEAVAGYLKDKNPSVRRKAAGAFGHADTQKVLEHLAHAVIDEDSLVKINAVKTIGRFGTEKNIVPLVLLLRDEDEDVRIESVKAIAKILCGELAPAGSKQGAVKYILPLLNDKDIAVKRTAIELLGENAGCECIEPLIEVLHAADNDICSEIISVLGRFDDKIAKDALIGIIRNNERASFLKNKALRILKINEDKKGLNIVLEVIKDPDADKLLKDAAFECMKRAGETIAVDAIAELMNLNDVNINISIAKLLKGFKDIRAEEILLTFLNDENDDIKRQAAVSLAYRGNDAGFAIIKEMIAQDGKNIYAEEICDAIKNIKNEKAVKLLIDCLEKEVPFLRYSAVKSIGSAGCREAVNSLIRLLDDENKDVRREAVIALGKIANDSVLFLLVSRLYDYERFNDMRRDVSLVCINISKHQTIRLILDVLNDDDRREDHWTCLEALSFIYMS